jgi:putative photosynthetic complex assembly protein
MSEREFGSEPLPRGPLIGAVALVVLTILFVTLTRFTGLGASQIAPSTPIVVRDLHFSDMPNGGIAVYDVRDDRPIEIVAPGTNGFLRATLRGLARERKRQGIGDAAPFRLVGGKQGRLTLEDPATGRRVDLEAFGATNAGVFARLLTVQNSR